jgi:hypothetical protein
MLLNDLIPKKAKQTRQEATSFENSLASEFRTLTRKSGNNLQKIKTQVNLHTDISKKENNIANKIAVISAMFSKNSLLEQLVHSRIEEKLSSFPKKTDEIDVKKPTVSSSPKNNSPKQKTPTKPKFSAIPSPQKKLSGGGVLSTTGIEKKKNVDPNIIPYANTLTLPLEASGIAAITTLGEFIKGTGSLGGFFKPYLKSVVTPFALALGVGQNIINTLLGGPVRAATLDLRDQQKYFGKTWGKFLNDADFVDQFIDREEGVNGGRPPGPASEDFWLLAVASMFENSHPQGAADVAQAIYNRLSLPGWPKTIKETIINPTQFQPVRDYGGPEEWSQIKDESSAKAFIKKYGQSEAQLDVVVQALRDPTKQADAAAFVGARDNFRSDAYEASNNHLDDASQVSRHGHTFGVEPGGLNFNNFKSGKLQPGPVPSFARGGYMQSVSPTSLILGPKSGYPVSLDGGIKGGFTSLTPYLASGSESGYDAIIQGIKVTLHGDEVVVPSADGFQVYPIKNKRYNIFEDPLGVTKRWKEIAKGANTQNVTSLSSGGSAEFWKIAAIASKEDTLHPQGQADVAQSLYNRASIGSYPGGKSISAIITAPGQYQPTFGNAATWNAIRDRKSAIAAAGSAQKVDMAAKSITNPSLQKEAQRFVGGRTDFQGESQKPYMKPEDITRGKNYNFHGWFYNARLAKPAPVPKIVSSQTTIVAPKEKANTNVIINRSSSQPQLNIIQQVQSAVTYIPNIIFNPHKLKKELKMRRAR